MLKIKQFIKANICKITAKFFTKKAAMFGMDARIALAVMALASIGVGINKVVSIKKDTAVQVKQEMKVLQAQFLKFWQEESFNGYISIPSNASATLSGLDANQTPGFGSTDKVVRFACVSSCRNTQYTTTATYLHPINSLSYVTKPVVNGQNLSSMIGLNNLFYHNMKNNYYVNSTGDYIGHLFNDIAFKTQRALNSMALEQGATLFTDVNNFEENTAYNSSNLTMFSGERSSVKQNIKFYFIVEHNIDQYSPSDYILHMVMYNVGPDSVLDTTLPRNINDLHGFTGASDDDIVNIFSTKQVYLKAKAESNERLEIIRKRVMQIAETAYLNRISDCRAETTPSANCDLDSDGDYDADDKNMLIDYNPFPKSSLDTTSVDYYNSATVYNYNSADLLAEAQDFLVNELSLPSYYAVDLFGNILGYNSNVGLSEAGPYTMEVWY